MDNGLATFIAPAKVNVSKFRIIPGIVSRRGERTAGRKGPRYENLRPAATPSQQPNAKSLTN
jgi:hypothetical protein